MELKIEVSNPNVGENDVRIEDFAGQRMHATWANGGPNVVVQPTDEVVLDVFGISKSI